jgi:hypothetical protein
MKKNKKLPNVKLFILSLLQMSLSGLALFTITVILYKPFADLVQVINKGVSGPINDWIWVVALSFGYGSLWLFFYLFFEISKKRFIDNWCNNK